MNGRKLFREYATFKRKDNVKEFVKIIPEWYNQDTLVTKDINGNIQETTIDYKEMVHWIIRNK